jgi:hypothetical protein
MVPSRALAIFGCVALSAFLCFAVGTAAYPSFDYDVARSHEVKPHRRTIPMDGVQFGSNQIQLKLTISPTGDVLRAETVGKSDALKFWPQLQSEVEQWKFTSFEKGGKAVTAEVEEYIDLVPPERLPKATQKSN